MVNLTAVLAPVRAIGRDRLGFLGYVTGGHTAIHWYQQIFAVVLPSIQQGLGLSNVQVGYLQSSRQLAAGTLNLPVGILADTFAKRQAIILASALLFMGLGYFLMGLAPALVVAMLGAGCIGIGTAVWHPPAMGALSNRFPDRRATALAVHGVGATVGDTLTPLAVGALLVSFNYQAVLRVQLIPAAIVAFVIWRALSAQFQHVGPRPSRKSLMAGMGDLMRNPVFVAVSLAQGLMGMSRQVILTFLPLYIENGLGYDAFELGIYIALLHVMGTVSQPVLGVLSDRWGRKRVLVPSYAVLGAFFLLLARATPGWQLVLTVLVIGIFFYTLTNVTTAAVLDVAGTSVQASANGLTSLIMQVIVLPAPIIAGWLVEQHGYGSSFVLSASFMFAGALIMLPLRMYQGNRKTPRFVG